MLGSALASLIALGVMSGAISGEDSVNCAETYTSYLNELEHRNITPQRRAALHRWAQRIYDACDTGDLENAKELFERLSRGNY